MRTWHVHPSVHQDAFAAIDDDAADGPVVVTWGEGDQLTDERCDGWLAGDKLFVPMDGQTMPGTYINPDGTRTDYYDEAYWYDVETGIDAVIWTDGTPKALVG